MRAVLEAPINELRRSLRNHRPLLLCERPPDQWGRPSGGAPHAVKARLYAGDCMLIVLGNSRIAPSKLVICWKPLGLDGIEVRGSGNWGTPCWRMHCAILTSFAIVWAEGPVFESGPLPGRGMNF